MQKKMAPGEWLYSLRFVFVSFCLLQECSFQLIVNVRTKEGNVVQQTFNSDPVKDFVSIDFKLDEERFVTVYLDFRMVSYVRSEFLFETGHLKSR